MNCAAGSLVTSFAIAACLLPGVASAQTVDPAGSRPVLSVEQVRDSFSRAGFKMQPALTWDWTSPPVTTLQIRDPSSDRVLIALVYPSTADAQAARRQAQAQDQALNPSGAASVSEPHLVPSYGPSVWTANVALVQTRQSDLNRTVQLQSDRDNCLDTADPGLARELDSPGYAVDLDFQRALSISVADL